MQALFIIDFDLTISSQHIHNLLITAIARGEIDEADMDAAWQYVKNIPPTGSAERWRNMLMQLIDAHYLVAIASFGSFPEIIYRYLKDKINLPEKYLQKIFIESWLPENPTLANKNEHIRNVIDHFHYQGDPTHVILVDDSEYNCLAARNFNWQVIAVKSGDVGGEHINAINTLAKKIAAEKS